MYLVSCILYRTSLVSCTWYPVSCILYPVPVPVSCTLYPVPGVLYILYGTIRREVHAAEYVPFGSKERNDRRLLTDTSIYWFDRLQESFGPARMHSSISQAEASHV